MHECPHCHKPLAQYRAGVLLPPLKARIFDVVAAAGSSGVTTRELIAGVYVDRSPVLATARHHIDGINDLLRGTGIRIRRKDHRRWVVKMPRRHGVIEGVCDIAAEIDDGLRAIKERMAKGGPGWQRGDK